MKDTTPYLVSIGFNGDVAVATYRLYISPIGCRSRAHAPVPVATDTYMVTIMVRPVVVSNNGGAIYGWAELSPEPYNNIHSVAWPAVHKIFMYWDYIDYGCLDKAFMESAYSYTRLITTTPILSTSIGLPISENSAIDANLLGIGVGLIRRGEAMSAASVIIGLDNGQVGDGSCELWPRLYRSNIGYYLSGGRYRMGTMYVDVYVYDYAQK